MAGDRFSSPALPRTFATLASAACFALMLGACDAGAPAPAGGVSKGEAQALAEAAEMLDETRRLPDEALPEVTGSSGQRASAEMTGDTAR
jgi:hypothetical protein